MADNRLRTIVKDLSESFSNAFNEERIDIDRNFRQTRLEKGESEDAPRLSNMTATYPTSYRIRENLGIADPVAAQSRAAMGMGLEKGPVRRAGQMLGTIAQDLVEDKFRTFYWLLNAPQATGAVIAEEALGRAVPELYKQRPILNESGNEITTKMPTTAKKMGIIADENRPYQTQAKYKIKDGVYVKDDYSSAIRSLAAKGATGVAINASLGLLTPMGGAEGYKAVFPDEEDPSKTTNPVLEVGAKYILGRRGGLLPYDEFKKVRPDVSEDEYRAYKAYQYDKRTDLNPFDDGKVSTPLGILKANADGINGAEVSFLGQTIPVNTGIVPYATALAGTIAGAKAGVRSKRAGIGGVIGGLGGLGAGVVAGNAIEQERRRRRLNDDPDGGQDTIGMGYM